MLLTTILQHYLIWHYTRGLRDVVHVWGNLLWFTGHFFSLGALARSLFAPYKRMVEERGSTWSFEDLAGFIVIGLLSRVLGFCIRFIIITVGLLVLVVVLLAGIGILAGWLIAPLIVIGLLLVGIRLLFVI
jgi:hypothetical protein